MFLVVVVFKSDEIFVASWSWGTDLEIVSLRVSAVSVLLMAFCECMVVLCFVILSFGD